MSLVTTVAPSDFKLFSSPFSIFSMYCIFTMLLTMFNFLVSYGLFGVQVSDSRETHKENAVLKCLLNAKHMARSRTRLQTFGLEFSPLNFLCWLLNFIHKAIMKQCQCCYEYVCHLRMNTNRSDQSRLTHSHTILKQSSNFLSHWFLGFVSCLGFLVFYFVCSCLGSCPVMWSFCPCVLFSLGVFDLKRFYADRLVYDIL